MPHVNNSFNNDSVYKIYSNASTLPNKNSTIEHDSSKDQKSLGGVPDTHESITFTSPIPETLYSSEASNADYFTLAGVCKRTGASKDELAVWATRQVLENAIDFNESNYDEKIHSRTPTITVSTKYDPKKNQLVIKVSNPNFGLHEIGFTETRIYRIFENLDRFVSSKRNWFKLFRGYQGDAMKEELGIPTALASVYNKGRSEWNEPLIIINGAGQEFKIRIVIDKLSGRNYAKIETNQTNKRDNITEVEIRLPYDEDIIDLDDIKIMLIKYSILNTHISFDFDLVDYIDTDSPFEVYEPYQKHLPATQDMYISDTSYKRLTRIYHFNLSVFENLLYTLESKNLLIYDILRAHFKEGHWISRDKDLLVPIGELQNMPEKESKRKIKDIFLRLRKARANDSMELGPSRDDLKTKRDMLPFHARDRPGAIVKRIEQLGFDVKNIKYKVEVGYHYSNPPEKSKISNSTIDTCVPYVVECAVIHTHDYEHRLLYCEGINASSNHYHSFTYDGYYHNYHKGSTVKQAAEAQDVLKQCGYSNGQDCKKEKERCIVLLNLWSTVVEFTDYGKSTIILHPFQYTVYNLLAKLCAGSNKPRDSKGQVLHTKAIFKEYLIDRYKATLIDPTLKQRDSWNTSTPVYRIRPKLEAKGLNPTRAHLQGLVKTICDEIPEMKITKGTESYSFTYTGKIGVKREALGIYEAARAFIYFRGSTYDVSFKRLDELKRIAAFILIIEKEGAVELLTYWADLYGVALCYTKGFLTENAKEFSRMAEDEGCNVVILSDMDFSGRSLANVVPNIHRIGITLQTLRILGIKLTDEGILEEYSRPKGTENKQNITYLNNKHATTAKAMYDEGLISKEDWKIMSSGQYGKHIGIDNVIAAAGAESFWKDLILVSYAERFGTADYTMSLNRIEYVVSPNLQSLNEVAVTYNKEINKPENEKIDSEYNEYNLSENGFIENMDAEEGYITDRIQKNQQVQDPNKWLESELAPLVEEYQKRTGVTIKKKEDAKIETKRYKVESEIESEESPAPLVAEQTSNDEIKPKPESTENEPDVQLDNSTIEDEIAKKHHYLSKTEIKRIADEMDKLQYMIKMARIKIHAVPPGSGRELELKRGLKEFETLFNRLLKESGISL